MFPRPLHFRWTIVRHTSEDIKSIHFERILINFISTKDLCQNVHYISCFRLKLASYLVSNYRQSAHCSGSTKRFYGFLSAPQCIVSSPLTEYFYLLQIPIQFQSIKWSLRGKTKPQKFSRTGDTLINEFKCWGILLKISKILKWNFKKKH